MTAVACGYCLAHHVHMLQAPYRHRTLPFSSQSVHLRHQYDQQFLRWDLFNQVAQLLPKYLIQLCVGVGFRWGIGNNYVNRSALTSQLEAHGHEMFVNQLMGISRITAYRFLDCQPDSVQSLHAFRFFSPGAEDPVPCRRKLCLPRSPRFLQADEVTAKLPNLRQLFFCLLYTF